MNETNATNGRTPSERRVGGRYLWEFSIGIVGYVVLFLVLPRIVHTQPGTTMSVVVALVPLLPVLWIVVAIARHLRRVDEFQRLLFLQSFTIGFGVAMLIALAVALLNGVDVSTPSPEWLIFIGGMSAWGISLAALSIRASR